MSVERTIADAIVTNVAARPYMTTNSIPVRRWQKEDANKSDKQALIMVAPRERLQPNANFYTIELQLQAVTVHADDEDGAINDGIYNDLVTWLGEQTAAGLSTLTGETIDGIVQQPFDEEFGEDDLMKFAAATLYATIN